jgi:two-component system LytT family sensor kinase
MVKISFRQKIYKLWLSLSIKKKIVVFTGVVFLVISLSFLFDIWLAGFSIKYFEHILENNARCSNYVDAIKTESYYFESYIKNSSEEKLKELDSACENTILTISNLPFDYNSMSESLYVKTWSIQNSYQVYEEQRNLVLNMSEENPMYIKELYKVYDMQKYLQEYGRTLIRYMLEDGTRVYEEKKEWLRKITIIVLILGLLLLLGIISFAHLMNRAIVVPIMKLVHASKKIASNEFFVADVIVENQDEMGKLVRAFNKMKYATGQYITALEEKRKTLDLLHQEELERLELEKRFESTKFELLKSQINPHFLFNTLNVIGGMADLENAKTTEKMIKVLSSLFRYNLKTPEAEVSLSQEIKYVEDYMYLQKMRFGSRINYKISCEVNKDMIYVPPFSFQPLVENSIIHGLSIKEEGGKIFIRIWKKGESIIIAVTDTGVGMTEEKLENLRRTLHNDASGIIGIGLGNINHRIQKMYRNSTVEIYSKINVGTAVRLLIPERKGVNINVSNTDCG